MKLMLEESQPEKRIYKIDCWITLWKCDDGRDYSINLSLKDALEEKPESVYWTRVAIKHITGTVRYGERDSLPKNV